MPIVEAVNLLPGLVGGLTAVTAVGAAVVDHEITGKISRLLDRSVYCGPTDSMAVALTFDDGPGPQSYDLLAYLEAERIPATFFQCGFNVQRFPEITRYMLAAGHEIGNHSWSHVRLSPTLEYGIHVPSPQKMHRELAQTQHLLASVCGAAPTLFRAPFGKRWVGLDAVQRRLGLRGIQWTVIGHDWEWPADRIAAHVLAGTGPGAIVCLHDGRDLQSPCDIAETLAAVKLIVPALRRQGYRFETVSSLLRTSAPGSRPA